jgi:uncharacterized membrane protein YvbJ
MQSIKTYFGNDVLPFNKITILNYFIMKLKSIIVIAMVAFLASCTNPESLLKSYEKACEAGNAVKAAQVLEDMEEKYPEDTDWTEDQMERIIEATATLAEKQTEDAMKALESLGGLGL